MGRNPVRYIVFWSSCFLALLYTVRAPLLSGWEVGVVGPVDGRLMLATLEHGYKSLWLGGEWYSPPWFYPKTGTLGYTDTFLLSVFPYSLLRSIGFSTIDAFTGVIALKALIGFFGFYFLLVRTKISPILASLGALLFIVGSPVQLALSNAHLQLLGVWLLPYIVLAVWNGMLQIETTPAKAAWWFSGAVVLYGLIAISFFYTAWNFAFMLLLAGSITLLLYGRVFFRSNLFVKYIRLLCRVQVVGLPLVACALVSVLFLSVYLPVRIEMSGRHISDAMGSLPEFHHLAVHNKGSIFWSDWLGQPIVFSDKLLSHEVAYGFPWGFLVLFLLSVVYLKFSRLRGGFYVAWVMALSVLLGWFLVLQNGGCSLWVYVFEYVPAADSIRAVFRINIIFYCIALLVTLWILDRVVWSRAGKVWLFVKVVLIAFLVVENHQNHKQGLVSNSDEAALVDVAKSNPVPQGITTFYVIRNDQEGRSSDWIKGHGLFTQVIAMRLSDHWNLPTINGYSGQFPKGWRLERRVFESTFLPELKSWVHENGIEGEIGIFNLDEESWSIYSQMEGRFIEARLQALQDCRGQTLSFGSKFKESMMFLEYGFGPAESEGRWLNANEASMWLRLQGDSDCTLHVEASYFKGSQETPVLLNGIDIGSFDFSKTKSITLPYEHFDADSEYQKLVFKTFEAVSPWTLGLSGDRRDLKLWFSSVRVE